MCDIIIIIIFLLLLLLLLLLHLLFTADLYQKQQAIRGMKDDFLSSNTSRQTRARKRIHTTTYSRTDARFHTHTHTQTQTHTHSQHTHTHTQRNQPTSKLFTTLHKVFFDNAAKDKYMHAHTDNARSNPNTPTPTHHTDDGGFSLT